MNKTITVTEADIDQSKSKDRVGPIARALARAYPGKELRMGDGFAYIDGRHHELPAAACQAQRDFAAGRPVELFAFTLCNEIMDVPTCQRCGDSYDLCENYEPTPECDSCAHIALAELRDGVASAANALTDSISRSGNDATTNLHFVHKLRALLA